MRSELSTLSINPSHWLENMPELTSIINEHDLCISRNPRGTDKLWPHSYIEKFYEKSFAPFKDGPTRLLEIGFRHGASLALWSTFFKNGQIVGIDNKSDPVLTTSQPINEAWTTRPNVTILLGDAYCQEFSDALDGEFDILIDDGPHTLSSQLLFIKLYIHKLADGGLAVIEDLTKFGGLLVWPLMLATPLKYEVDFHDYRSTSGIADDMIFAIRNSGKNQLSSRGKLLLRGIYYVLVEPVRIPLRKLLRKLSA